MSGFQALMALSASQTKESQSAVQTALLQRQRNEAQRRKQQEEQDRKRRDLEQKLRLKHFEDEKREQERMKRIEEERKAKEAVLQRREESIRDALRYGPKKAKANSEGATPKWPSSSSQSQSREEVRKRRLPDDDDDSAPEFLTREEKRERKQQLERRKLFQASKRTSNATAYMKSGRRLPGGAVDVATPAQSTGSPSGSQSVKERIAAMPNTLTKLNTVKRDTRTIDEILQDRAKAREVKVLDGDEAREFNDWFGTAKKKEPAKKTVPPRLGSSAPTSGTNTPLAFQGSNLGSTPALAAVKKASGPAKPSPLKSVSKSSGPASAGPKATSASRSGSTDKYASSKASSAPNGKAPKSAGAYTTSNANGRSNGSSANKRPRSSSRSESPPPQKKRAASPGLDISTEIWKMFGRKREAYVGMDVLSDDEDMEADATALEREEHMSARIAKREEMQALEEERRHEEEKRRRKKEKEKEARGR